MLGPHVRLALEQVLHAGVMDVDLQTLLGHLPIGFGSQLNQRVQGDLQAGDVLQAVEAGGAS